MTDWQAEYQRLGWDRTPTGEMMHAAGGIYANGSDATVKLTARVDGDFIVVTLCVLGVKVAEKRSAVEDPLRAAQLMGEVLRGLKEGVEDAAGACVIQPSRIR